MSESVKAAFKGCYVATVTPFNGANRLDAGAIHAQVAWLIENGVEGLCPAGTTGEFLYLTDEEKRQIITATVEAAGGKIPTIAGVWAFTSAEAADLARHAEASGAQGVFLPTPIYYPAGDNEIFQWYEAIARATTLPLFAYNIPQYAANTVSIACLQRLFEAGLIAGVKDSTGKSERVSELVRHFGAEHVVFAASDGFATEGRKLGADGFISAIANATPALFARLWAGDESLQPKVDALRTTLKQMGSIAALKYLLQRQGFPFGNARLPFSTLTESHKQTLDAIDL